jgi:hypothetical protein
MSQPIHLNDQGPAVQAHQEHLNDRLRAHGNHTIKVTGSCDRDTIAATALAGWFLGALDETVKKIQHGEISTGVQQIVADPDSRDDAQRSRARERRGKIFPGEGPGRHHKVITCAEWGAVAPTQQVSRVGRPDKIIFHHTDGHHPEIDHEAGDTIEEAKAFARSIQHDHMHRPPPDGPYIDSGHNFLVTRSGHILEGRHGSLAAIEAGVMVRSAHCPSQNTNPGIEHEHKGNEAMTPAQREASLFLHALICRHTGIKPGAVHRHGEFSSTECPGALKSELDDFRKELARRLG